MEGLNEQEQKFFESGGESEVVDDTVTDEVKTETITEAPKPEVVAEKKKPSKFEFSESTNNVVDDLGQKYVPLPAVQREREENKKLRAKLEELENNWKGGEQKLNQLLAKIEAKEKPLPDPKEDPLGHLQHKNQELEKKLQALEEGHGEIKKEKEETSKYQQFSNTVQSAEKAFATANPDYAEAVTVVQEMWKAELEIAGVPENFIDTMLARKGAQFSHAALQKEQNPAEAVYKLAQRYGYKKAQKEAPKEESKDKDKLKTIAQGQEAEKSLTSGKGPTDMSLEALKDMSDEEMESFIADPKNWKKLSKAA
jgi:hypothetical protein